MLRPIVEHRWDLRVPIAIPVVLNYRHGAYGRGFARNIRLPLLVVHWSRRGIGAIAYSDASARGPIG